MDKLKTGIVGVGSVVREIYQHLYFNSRYAPLLDIVAVADPNDEYRAWFCDSFGIPAERRFTDWNTMYDAVELDAVMINTPDRLHAAPTIDAFARGLDVVLPKPLADTVKDAHAMVKAAREQRRLLGVDFHKREDPRLKEAALRIRSGRYGTLQNITCSMIDKLFVADPNHEPVFFATHDYAEKNSPISFLTVHMADAIDFITGLNPVSVRATGWSQKLPSLAPIPVNGYDLCDTEVRYANGAVAHMLSGWHLPNTAHATSVQQARLVFTDGLLDLAADTQGYREIHAEGISELNPLFQVRDGLGRVSGFGMDVAGRLFETILARRNGALPDEALDAMLTPGALGFNATLICQGAEESLAAGADTAPGVTTGVDIDLAALLQRELGDAAADYPLT